VVIAVAAVGVVEMAVDEVVDVIAVGDGFVTAVGAVNVVSGVAGAGMAGGAVVGIFAGDGEGVFVVVVAVVVVEMAVVKEVDVAVVEDGGMAAAGAVDVDVIGFGMNAVGHEFSFSNRAG
jgi:hypothetical protein